MKKGYLAIVLNAHLPYIRNLEDRRTVEERWLFEAVIECYIPLLQKLSALEEDGIPFKLTIALSPTLCAMLGDELLSHRTARHLSNLEKLAEKEIERTNGSFHLQYLATFYRRKFEEIRKFWEKISGDIIGVFKSFEEKGYVEIIAGAATHGYLPLLAIYDEAVRWQIKTGVQEHIRLFSKAPHGIWLPECGYYPGLEYELARNGIHFFIVETKSLSGAPQKPRYGIYAPVYTPAGVAAFGRDPESSKQVWSAETGYPGDPWYRDFYRDIGFDLPNENLWELALPDGERTFTGIKYHRITHKDKLENKDLYHPNEARQRASEHAGNFVLGRLQRAKQIFPLMDRPPVFVAPYDAELFGHWWFEGPEFLDFVFRKLYYDQNEIEPITLSEYLIRHPLNQMLTPAEGSWGANGDHSVWLSPSNAWMWRYIHAATKRMSEMIEKIETAKANEILLRAVAQAGRELLLAQSSDWAFMLFANRCVEFAKQKFTTHIEAFKKLANDIEKGKIEISYLEELEKRDNIFPELDINTFKKQDNRGVI